MLPILFAVWLCVFIVTVRVQGWNGSNVKAYLIKPRFEENDMLVRVLQHSLKCVTALLLCGVLFIIIDLIAPGLYDDYKGGDDQAECYDPLLRITTAQVTTPTHYQWVQPFLLLSCCPLLGSIRQV